MKSGSINKKIKNNNKNIIEYRKKNPLIKCKQIIVKEYEYESVYMFVCRYSMCAKSMCRYVCVKIHKTLMKMGAQSRKYSMLLQYLEQSF